MYCLHNAVRAGVEYQSRRRVRANPLFGKNSTPIFHDNFVLRILPWISHIKWSMGVFYRSTVVLRDNTNACERKREFQPHCLKQLTWLEYKSSSAGAGVAAHAGVGSAADRRDDDADRRDDDADRRDDDADRRDDDADRRDDDAVVDVEGGESDGTAKKTETELSMRMFCKYYCKYEKAGSFVVGSPVFKLESIKAHNSYASHMKWALREKAESNPGSSVADKTMDRLGIVTDIGDIDTL